MGFGEPRGGDDRFSAHDGVDDTAKTTTSPDGSKAYGDGTGGWFAYAVGGNLFLKKFTDTPANQQRYPQPGSQKPGCGFPVMKFVVLFSLCGGAVLNVLLGNLSMLAGRGQQLNTLMVK